MRLLLAKPHSPEHYEARRGRVTGSVADVIVGGTAHAWNKLADQIRSGDASLGGLENVPSIAWGNKHEPMARGEFWSRHPELDIETPAFAYYWNDQDPLFASTLGFSPDFVLLDQPEGQPKGGQVKCPYNPANHEGYIQAGVCPPDYFAQVQFEMFCANSPSWYFISFDPRETDPERRYFEVVVPRDPAFVEDLEAKLIKFIGGLRSGERFLPPTRNATTLNAAF